MIARNFILSACAGIAAASLAGAASAGDASHGVHRTEVVAEVLRASTLGTLVPAGEATPFMATSPAASALERATVKRSTLMAIHNGVMLPAGETAPYSVSGGPSTTTRAERKAEVLRARAAGELLAAGEGEYVVARPAAVRTTETSDSGSSAQVAAR